MAKLYDSFEISLIPVSENRFIHPQTKYLHVKNSVVATDGVFKRPYWEIKHAIKNADGESLGFEDNEEVSCLITKEELEKGCDTFNGLQLMSKHGFPTIDNNLKELEVGHLLNHKMENGELINEEMVIKDKKTKQKADKGELKGLSIGYNCEILYNPGTYNGNHHDFELTEIQGSHLNITRKTRQRNPRANLGDSLESNFNQHEEINMEQSANFIGRVLAQVFGSDKGLSNDSNKSANLGDNLEAENEENVESKPDADASAAKEETKPEASNSNAEFVTKEQLESFGSTLVQKLTDSVKGMMDTASTVKNKIDEKTTMLIEIAKKIQGDKYATVLLGDSEEFDAKLNRLLQIRKADNLLTASEKVKLWYLKGVVDGMPAVSISSKANLGDSLDTVLSAKTAGSNNKITSFK